MPVAFERILVGFDGSDGAQDALALARSLADRTGAELVLGGVLPGRAVRLLAAAMVGGLERDVERDFADKVERAAAELAARSEVVLSGSAPQGLNDLAEDIGADLIVLGSSKTASGRVRTGRTATQLLQGGPAAVAVAPVGYRHGKHDLAVIGVGIDGSAESHEALRTAIELARGGSALRLVSVAFEPFTAAPLWSFGSWGHGLEELDKVVLQNARDQLDAARATAPDDLPTEATALAGDVPSQLCDEADKGMDLLCLGSRAYGPVRRVLLGSVSAAVIANAPCPVLVVPRPHCGSVVAVSE